MTMRKYKGFAIGLLSGCMLMLAVPTFAAAMKQYVLTEATYPVYVNDEAYAGDELPILSYQGNTYIPMRAVGTILGATVQWNGTLKRAEVYYDKTAPIGNNAFRNVAVSGANGKYVVTGEARVFEASMNYAVSDGHNYLVEKAVQLHDGAPAWSPFKLDIVIPKAQWPANGTLMLELFEYSAQDGSRINEWSVPLESFP